MLPDNPEDLYELIHHRLPASVDPESPLGQHYARLIESLESRPPYEGKLSSAQLDEIAILLWGAKPRGQGGQK